MLYSASLIEMDNAHPQQLAEFINYTALQLGFVSCKFAAIDADLAGKDWFEQWLDSGKHGSMQWMERSRQKRLDTSLLLPAAATVVMLAYNYYPGDFTQGSQYSVARYAWGKDYHDIIEQKLADMCESLADLGIASRYYVDTGPLLERSWAAAAGLGWNGKSAMQILKDYGPWCFLAAIVIDRSLPPSAAYGQYCGSCVRCLQACPTGAIEAPHRVNAAKCIAYLTIEYHGVIEEPLLSRIGTRLYGCDECLQVCPWHRFAKQSSDLQLAGQSILHGRKLRDLLCMTPQQFSELFAGSPIKRIKYATFMRNVCIVAGNSGDKQLVPLLEPLCHSQHPVLAEHASLALKRLQDVAY